jgi:hypothetical protein
VDQSDLVFFVVIPVEITPNPNKWAVLRETAQNQNRHLLGEFKLLNLSTKLEEVQDSLLRGCSRDMANNDKVGGGFGRNLEIDKAGQW